MATEKDQYNNLFGSDDDDSDEEEEQQQQAPPPPPPPPQAQKKTQAAKPAPAPAPAPASKGVPDLVSSAGESSSESSDDESSDEEDEEEQQPKRPAANQRLMGVSALARATQEVDGGDEESEEEEEERKKPAATTALSEESESESSSSEEEEESASSDDEGDSRRKKKGKGGGRIKRGGSKSKKEKKDKKDKERKPKAKKERRSESSRDGGGGGGGGAAAARAPARELTAVEQAMAKMKRRSSAKLPEKQVQEMTQRLIDLMEGAAREDKQSMSQHRPATAKLRMLNEVMDLLRSKHLQGALVDNGQLLGNIKMWLHPLPDKSLPMFAIRSPLIDYLVTARVEVHRLKESGIGSVIQKLSKHPEETVENKAKLREIIDNWSRLITGKGATLKTRTTEDMEGRTHGELNRGTGGGDGYYISKTARGVEIPIRTGFNFKKVALTFKEEYDRGQGKEDEALEVMERAERGEGVESRTSKVRKALKDMSRGGSKKLRHESVSHGHN